MVNTETETQTEKQRDRGQRLSHSTDGAVTGLRVRPRRGQVAGGGPGHMETASFHLPADSTPPAGLGRFRPPPSRVGAWRWRTMRPSGSARGCWPP